MNFIDYESSYITPQKTLLKKLNAILDFLENSQLDNSPKLYKHTILFQGGHPLIWVDNNSADLYEFGNDLKNAILKSLSTTISISYYKVVGLAIAVGTPSSMTIYYANGTSISSVSYSDSQIVSHTVEKYV